MILTCKNELNYKMILYVITYNIIICEMEKQVLTALLPDIFRLLGQQPIKKIEYPIVYAPVTCTVERANNLNDLSEIPPYFRPGFNYKYHQFQHMRELMNVELTHHIQLTDGTYLDTKLVMLVDPPGRGKTIIVLALICYDRGVWVPNTVCEDLRVIYRNTFGNVLRYKKTTLTRVRCSVVTAPLNIVKQWEEQTRKFTVLKVVVIQNIYNITSLNPNDHDLLIIPTTIWNNFITHFQHVIFRRIIIDEIDNASLPSMAEGNANIYIGMTGTSEHLSTRLKHLRTSHFLKELHSDPGLIDALSIGKADNYESEEKYDVRWIKLFSSPNKLAYLLENVVNDTILRYIKARDLFNASVNFGYREEEMITGVRTYLINTEARILGLIEAVPQSVAYRDRLTAHQALMKEFSERVLKMNHRFCYMCSKPAVSPVINECSHLYCTGCINMKDICIVCNRKIGKLTPYTQPTDHIDLDYLDPKSLIQGGDEYIPLHQIVYNIMSTTPGKYLIFCFTDGFFDNLIKYIPKGSSVRIGVPKGNSRAREKILSEFEYGGINCLALNSVSNGSGMNLQSANAIIFVGDITLHEQNQCIGRVCRIGHDPADTVNIYTIE